MLGFRCVGGKRNPRSLSQQWPSNRSTGIIVLLIDIVSLSSQGRPLATNSAKALQRAAESLLFKLPAAAAVQSSELDLKQFVDYSPASALPARRTCRSDSASNLNVQRPRACAQANVQRPRAEAQASAGEQGGRSKKEFTKIRSDTCKYGPILTYVYDTDMSVCDTDMSVSYTDMSVSCTYICTYLVRICTYYFSYTFRYISSYLTKIRTRYVQTGSLMQF